MMTLVLGTSAIAAESKSKKTAASNSVSRTSEIQDELESEDLITDRVQTGQAAPDRRSDENAEIENFENPQPEPQVSE